MYEYGVSVKSVRICKNIADLVFTLDVLQFFNNDEKSSRYTWTKRSFGKASKSYSLRGVSGV